MKSKLRNLLLAAMALMLFAGCGNLALNDATVEGSDAGDKCVLTISYSDLEGLLPPSAEPTTVGGARTIDPKKYTKGENTTFKIEGTSARKLKLKIGETEAADGLYEISFDSDNKANLALDYDVWYLTLHAYESDVEVLKGVTTVDLNKAVPEISFKLSTKGVTSEGGLDITVTGLTSAVKSYTAGLYDINTDKLKYNLLASADGENLDDGNAETPLPTSKQLTKSGVVPGDYIFKFIPYNDTVENKNTREDLTPYSDVITIAPARTTTASVALSIMQVPNAPSGFSVSLVDASEADKDDYYTVRLNWTDNSDNEENFVLRIYKADGTEANAAAVTVESNLIATFDKNFVGYNDYYVSGTLGMSTTTCDVKLKTGTLYEMTLTAKNRAGESAVCTRDASEDNETDGLTGFADTVRINRQKITYNYMGGTRTKGTNKDDGTGETTVSSDLNEVIYRTYDGTAYTLMTIAGTGYAVDDATTPDVNEATNTDKLIYNDHPWKEWTTLPNAGAPISTILATEYADKMVYASYNQNVNVTYSVADEYRTLNVSWACSADGATATVATEPVTNKLELDVTNTPTVTGGSIVFNIAKEYKPYGSTDSVSIGTLDKIIVIINGGKPLIRAGSEIESDASNYKYSYSLNNFRTSGVYNITIIGEIDGHYYSGAPIALTVDIK